MGQNDGESRRWFWATVTLSCVSVATIVCAIWEMLESWLIGQGENLAVHYFSLTRGIVSSLLLALWSGWYVTRQRRRGEDQLRASREYYRRLLDASPGAVVLFDGHLTVLEWNDSAESIYGIGKEEALGLSLATVPDAQMAELREFLRRIQAGESVANVETRRRHRSGHEFGVELTLRPFKTAAGMTQYLEVTENIEERAALRRHLLDIEKLASMGRMAAGTAHHLNTPLAAMLLRLQMMRERALDPTLATDLDRLEKGIGFCRHFVQRLLDFSRHGALEKRPLEVAQTIRSTVSFLGPALVAKRASVSLDLAQAEGHWVLADRNMLEVLFSTLISNALDAIADHGALSIGCGVRGEAVEIRIRDNGRGISQADQERVFEPFYTTKAPGKGTGLGLAIARNIVLEHDGSIRLESAPGEGTTVFIRLGCCAAPVDKGTALHHTAGA